MLEIFPETESGHFSGVLNETQFERNSFDTIFFLRGKMGYIEVYHPHTPLTAVADTRGSMVEHSDGGVTK